jgi:5,10-methylene-tetrahydrofolate dehydrogenase/methenyl tetrahydrofolate cyclohydrolase
MRLLSGKELAADLRAVTAARSAELNDAGRGPRFAVVTPGGVGPVTTALLMRHVVEAAAG